MAGTGSPTVSRVERPPRRRARSEAVSEAGRDGRGAEPPSATATRHRSRSDDWLRFTTTGESLPNTHGLACLMANVFALVILNSISMA